MRTARLLERISGVDERFEQLQHHVRTDSCLWHPLVEVHYVSDAQAEQNKARKRLLSVWQDIKAVVFEDTTKFLRYLFPKEMEAVNIATLSVAYCRFGRWCSTFIRWPRSPSTSNVMRHVNAGQAAALSIQRARYL